MSEGQTANFLYMLLLLVLVGSSLIARRLPMGQTLKMVIAWVAIFAVGFFIVSLVRGGI
ncbi:hypothetical protein [Sphingomonas sanxanigenens]|uniref:Uncharacterized protein n=1 Tax=Sphingomonas sanxanigenens DSM 19645 = NX02 TaxID=1123269 RepID=W0A8J5_9SPHN|nr:hypothetical protein [Sphingomonas sanxanigenens]AHE54249.1 hypothetical protein NX02_12755 [Sphingomonas sanxanigenens DSM 19645 = NX02]